MCPAQHCFENRLDPDIGAEEVQLLKRSSALCQLGFADGPAVTSELNSRERINSPSFYTPRINTKNTATTETLLDIFLKFCVSLN